MKKLLSSIFLVSSSLMVFACHKKQSLNDTLVDIFYKQVILQNNIKTDKDISNFYLPRNITKQSITPRLWLPSYGDVNILNMSVNGYFQSTTPFRYKIQTDEVVFFENKSFLFDYYAFFNGKCYSLKEAYEKQIISKEYFKSTNPSSDIKTDNFYKSKKYYDQLPNVQGYNDNRSKLVEPFQTIKQITFDDLFNDKSVNNDKYYFDIAKEDWDSSYFNEHYFGVRKVNIDSIYLRMITGVVNDKVFFEVDINALSFFHYEPTFFIESRKMYLDGIEYQYYGSFDPLVYTNDHVYLVSDAYSKGLIKSSEIEELRSYKGPHFPETRRDEYLLYLPPYEEN